MKYFRNGFVGMFVTALLIVMLAACGGNAQAEREIYETAIDDMLDAMGVPPIFSEGEDNTSGSVDGGEQAVADIDLGLQIVVQNTTFGLIGPIPGEHRRNTYMRITKDGHLQRSIGRIENDEWETIDTDVRTFELAFDGPSIRHIATFYIKNDNSLWAVGSNTNGLLGDGTGLDRDEPVRILDNVADVKSISYMRVVYALLIDGSLLRWGSGDFAPVHSADNVVRFSENNVRGHMYQTSFGFFYLLSNNRRVMERPAFDLIQRGPVDRPPPPIFINYSHNLMAGDDTVAENVKRLFNINMWNIFFIKQDGSLWGQGQNANGELGDGTRAPRIEAVHIADGVVDAGAFFFFTSDGMLWSWDENNPTPQPAMDNAVAFISRGHQWHQIHLADGSVEIPEGFEFMSEIQIIDNVKIPNTITFD